MAEITIEERRKYLHQITGLSMSQEREVIAVIRAAEQAAAIRAQEEEQEDKTMTEMTAESHYDLTLRLAAVDPDDTDEINRIIACALQTVAQTAAARAREEEREAIARWHDEQEKLSKLSAKSYHHRDSAAAIRARREGEDR